MKSGVSQMRAGNNRCQHYSFATHLATRDNQIASVAEYDEWFASLGIKSQGGCQLTGAKIRRMVQMKRNGCSAIEIGHAVSLRHETVRKWLKALPLELSA